MLRIKGLEVVCVGVALKDLFLMMMFNIVLGSFCLGEFPSVREFPLGVSGL